MPDYEWDVYNKSVPMSTYLVAFAVTDLAVRESDPGLSDTLFRGQWREPRLPDSAPPPSDDPRMDACKSGGVAGGECAPCRMSPPFNSHSAQSGAVSPVSGCCGRLFTAGRRH